VQKQSSFTIYNASAGSGKTFTLVKDYLKILFHSKSKLAFRNILALTFTNKAVGEMKARVIDMLKTFSEDKIIHSPNSMFSCLVEELEIEPKVLQQRAKIILLTIVHNYAAFDISTIDKFNHKLIRTFAYDLKLPVNFEVELDTQTMLGKAVDKLIDQAGSEDELTKVLVDFAIEKTDDDKSWDISYDFNTIAELLVKENDIPYLNQLKDKTLKDFEALKTNLQKQQKNIEKQIIALSKSTLELIQNNGLNFEDFSYKTLPNHFKKANELDFHGLYKNKLQDNLAERTKIYSRKLDAQKASVIERLLPEIENNYLALKRLVYTSKFLNNALKNITPLSVLSAIAQTLQTIKEEDDLLLISEFNSIINTEIKAQPAPFIYERIGEKFKHYFIDEFQDTSALQWENLIPLMSNALVGENEKGDTGTAMIVGDAKQAIYRWRGGRAEQFIDLYSEGNPFHVEKDVKNLPTNFRSSKTIVEFNNEFFNHISTFAFSNEHHQHIYKNASQLSHLNTQGFVELSFLNIENEDKNQLAIISSESLLINNAPEVRFINNLITLSLQPKNEEVKIKLLSCIADQLQLDNKHGFFDDLIHLNLDSFFKKLNEFGFDFGFSEFLQSPIYEAIESVIRGFHLHKKSNAYIQFYLDEVFDYSQKYNASLSGFLEYWERKKDKLTIASPSGKDAIQIMTIHKSKGLEFPVVIFPYANQDIYFDMNPKVWFEVDETLFNGFSYLYLNMNKDLEEFNPQGAILYNEYQSQLELDSINLLYVVLTRAVEQLYVISEHKPTKKSINEKPKYYSELFISYLKSIGKWNDNQTEYQFGKLKKTSIVVVEDNHNIEQHQFISTKKEDHNLNIVTSSGYLWDTVQEKAIERGNLVHEIMAFIKTKDDVDFALNHFLDSGVINSEQLKELHTIIDSILAHEQLSYLFDSALTIYNEKDIISKEGKLLRPDRVVINSLNQATIVDYKTGLENSKYKEQLYDYQYVLEEMGFEIVNKVLIYINDKIVIKEF